MQQPKRMDLSSGRRAVPVTTVRGGLALTPLARAIMAAGLLASPVLLQAAGPVLPPLAAGALPTGLQIGAGQATVQTLGNQMVVRNSNGAVLNWKSFDIGAAAAVRFDQANAASKVLNRVTGDDPSRILGQLSSNGQVWLVNPNGILFGQGARVDVAGLVASTLRLGDSDFLAQRYRFLGDPTSGTVRNEGVLHTAWGGQVLLLGPQVENAGSIEAPGGLIALAAGRSIDLVDTGLPNLQVRLQGAGGTVRNVGRLVADDGRIDVFGAIVNQDGLVQADRLSTDGVALVRLQADDTLLLGDASRTQAVGQGAGTVGGGISLQAARIGLLGQAQVEASGVAGGGAIRVGGGLPGDPAPAAPAVALWIGPQASLRADALGDAGSGGRILLWSENATRAYGQISARGGALSGDGGFVEVSSKGVLDWQGRADLRASTGQMGTLLLDPRNLRIVQSGANVDGAGHDLTTPDLLFASFSGVDSTITSTALNTQLNSANVRLQADQDISVAAGLTTAVSGPRGLTMQAGRNIQIDSAVTARGGLTLSANDPGGQGDGSGRVTVNAALDAGSSSLTISNNGGSGVHQLGANLNAGRLTVAGAADVSASSVWTLSTNGSAVSGVLGGTGDLTKAGAGDLALTAGAQRATAGTTVTAGSIAFGGASNLGALTVQNATASFVTGENTLASLRLEGGTLAGSGAVTVTGGFTAAGSGATVSGSGVFTTQGSTSIDLSAAGGALTLQGGRTWINQGALTLGGDDQLLFGYVNCCSENTTFTNAAGGSFTIASSNATPIGKSYYAGATFNNAGQLTKQSAGTQTIDLSTGRVGALHNSGTVNVQAGALRIGADGTDTGRYVLAAGAAVDFGAGTRTLASTSNPAGTGAEWKVSGAAVTLNTGGDADLLPLTMSAGSLSVVAPQGATARLSSATVNTATLSSTGEGVLRIGTLALNGSTLAGNGPVTVTDSLTAGGTGATVTGAGVLTTQGSTSIGFSTAGGALTLQGGRTWINQGALTLGGDDQLLFGYANCCSENTAFTNAAGGTFTIASSNATPVAKSYYAGATFNNDGQLIKQAAGTQAIDLTTGRQGSFHNTGSVSVQAGKLRIGADGTDTGGYALASGAALEFSAGTRVLSAASNPTGAGGAWAVSGGSVSLSGQSGSELTSLPLSVSGGSLNLQNEAAISLPALNLSGGSLTLNSTFASVNLPSELTVANATLNLSAAQPSTVSRLTLDTATLGGTGSLTVTGDFSARGNGATLTGAGVLTTQGNGSINFSAAGGALTLQAGRTWINQGALTLGGDDQLLFGYLNCCSENATFTNAASGTFTVASTHATPIGKTYWAGATFNNAGQLNKQAAGAQSIDLATGRMGAFHNTGAVSVQAGALRIGGDGTDTGRYALADGTTLEFAAGTRSMASPGNPTGATAGGGAALRVSGGAVTLTGGDSVPMLDTTVSGSAALTISGGIVSLPSLTVKDSATVTMNATGTLRADQVAVSGGSASLSALNGVAAPQLSLSGGTLALQSTFGPVSVPSAISVSNGNLSISTPVPVTLDSLSLQTAELQGSAAVTVTGAFTAGGSSAGLRGSGTLTTLGTSTISFDGAVNGALTLMSGRSWVNQGVLNLLGDDRLVFGSVSCCGGEITGFTNASGAVFNLRSTSATPIGQGTWAVGTFSNAGTFNKWAAGAQNLDLREVYTGAFHNSGTLQVAAGSLSIQADGNDSGRYRLADGTALEFGYGTRTLAAASNPALSSASGSAALRVSGGAVTLSGGDSVAMLDTTVSGSASLAVTGGTITLPALAVKDSATVSISAGRQLQVSQLTQTGGSTTLAALNDLAAPQLALSGGSLALQSTFGALQVPADLDISGANLSLSAPVATTLNSLTLKNAELQGTGAVVVTGDFIAKGASAGLRGSGTFTTKGTSTIAFDDAANGALTLMQGRSWTNDGVLNLLGDDRLVFGSVSCCGGESTSFTNSASGIINVRSTSATPFAQGTWAVGGFTNAGTLNKLADGPQSIDLREVYTGSFHNTGSVNVSAGSLVIQADGTDTGRYQLAAGTSLEFGYGTRTLAAASNPGGGAALRISGGSVTLSGGDAVTLLPTTVSGGAAFTVTGGSIAAPTLTLRDASSLSLTAGTTLQVDQASFSAGTATLGAQGDLTLSQLAQTGGTVTLGSTAGALRLPAALNLGGGSLALNASVALTFDSLVLKDSTLGGSANVTVTGDFNARGAGAGLQGSGTLTTRGTSTVDFADAANGALAIGNGRSWINQGTLNLQGDDRLLFNGSCCSLETMGLVNAAGARLNLLSTAAKPIDTTGYYIRPTLRNEGLISKTGSGAQTLNLVGYYDYNGALVNLGTVDVAGGTLSLVGGLQQSGTLQIASGVTLALRDNLTNLAGAVISGNGTLSIAGGGGKLVNQGQLRPGGAGGVGTLTVQGQVDLGGGVLAVDLAGPGQGDRLVVNGNVTLGGTVAAALAPGYTPATADAVGIVTATGTRSGLFSAVTGAQGFVAGYGLATGEAARLIFGAADGLPTLVFSNAAGDLDWSNAANWGGSLPGSGNTAVLSSGLAVNHTRGTTVLGGLRIGSGNALAVTGGSFTVNYDARIDGTLSLAGTGSVTLGGPVSGTGRLGVAGGRTLTVQGSGSIGSLSLDNGTLAGLGAVTVTDGFSVLSGGGVLAGAGSLTTQGSTTLVNTNGAVLNLQGGRSWINAGSATVGGTSRITLGSGVCCSADAVSLINTASGTLRFESSAINLLSVASYAQPTVSNQGLIVKAAGGRQVFVVNTSGNDTSSFNNSGTLQVDAGTLALYGGGTDTGRYTLAAGTQLEFDSGTRVIDGQQLQLGSAARLRAAGGSTTLNLAGDAQLPAVTVTGGVLNATTTGSLTALDFDLQSGGTLNLGSAGKPVALASQDLNLSGGTLGIDGTITLRNVQLTNAGLGGAGDITITGGFNLRGSSATVTGSGTLRTQGTTNVNFANAAGGTLGIQGGRQWLNAGTVQVDGDDGIVIGSPYCCNVDAATLRNLAGAVIDLRGNGTQPLTGGTWSSPSLINEGTINKSGAGTQWLGPLGSGSFQNSGTVSIGQGVLRVGGSGTDTGRWLVASGATLDFAGGTRTLSAASLPVSLGAAGGGMRVSGASLTLNLPGDVSMLPVEVSSGSLAVRSTGNLSAPSLSVSGGSLSFDSAGGIALPSLTVSGGTASLLAAGPLSVGALAQTGGSLSLGSSTAGLSLPSDLSIKGSLTLNSPDALRLSSLVLDSATLDGSTSITVTGALDVRGTGAAITGSGSLRTEGSSTVAFAGAAGGMLRLGNGRTWTNAGSLTVGGDDQLLVGSPYCCSADTASLINLAGATLTLSSTHANPLALGTYSSSSITNAGTLLKSAAGSQLLGGGNSGQFSNSGTVSVQSGTLRIQASGKDTGDYTLAETATLDFAGGTRVLGGRANPATGAGVTVSGATVTLAAQGDVALRPLTVSAGSFTLEGNGTLQSPSITVTGGSVSLSAGSTATVPSVAVSGGTLSLQAAQDLSIGALALTGGSTTLGSTLGALALPGVLSLRDAGLTLNGSQTTRFSTLTLDNSSLSGSDGIAVSELLSVQGAAGAITGSGALRTDGRSSINLSSAGGLFRVGAGRQWTNTGTVVIGGDDALLLGTQGCCIADNATLNNTAGGRIELATTAAAPIVFGDYSMTGALNNAGLLLKQQAGTQTLRAGVGGTGALNNTGTVQVDAGSLVVSAGGTDTGRWRLADTTTLEFAAGTRTLASASNPAGGAGWRVSGGSVTLATLGDAALLPLSVSGGSLQINATGTLTLPNLAVSGGTVTAAATDTLAASHLQIGGGTVALSSGTILSAPDLALTGGSLALSAGPGGLTLPDALAVSGATLSLNTPRAATVRTLTLDNATLAGSGELVVTGDFKAQGASVTLNEGTLDLNGDDRILFGTVSCCGAEITTLINAGGASFNLNTSAAEPLSASGNAAAPQIVNAGTLHKTNAAAQTFALRSTYQTGDFSNSGTVDLAAGTLTIKANGSDTGAWTLAAGTTLDLNYGTRNWSADANPVGAGNLRITGSDVTLNGNAAALTLRPLSLNAGSLTVNTAGALTLPELSLTGGSLVLSAGPGAITLPQDVTVSNATLSLSGTVPTTVRSLTLDNATLAGSGELVVSGDFRAQGAAVTLNEAGTLRTQGHSVVDLSATGGSLSLQRGRRWINEGALDLNGDDRIAFASVTCCGAEITTLINAAGASFSLNTSAAEPLTVSGNAAAPQIVNAGTLHKTNAAAQTIALRSTYQTGDFSNSGTVDLAAGSLTIKANGSDTGAWTLATGTTLDLNYGTRAMSQRANPAGAGNWVVSGATVTLDIADASAVLRPLAVSAGGLAVTAAGGLSLPSLTLSGGTLDLSAGVAGFTLPQDLTVTNAALGLSSSQASTVRNLTLDNATLRGSGDLVVTGSFRAQGAAAGLDGSGALRTQGTSTVDLSATNGSLTLTRGRQWINQGTLNLNGDDRIVFSAVTCCAPEVSTLVNANGAVFNLNTSAAEPLTTTGNYAAQPLFNNLGTLHKTSSAAQTLALRGAAYAGTFTQAGTLDLAAGTLAITGNLVQTGDIVLASGSTLTTPGDLVNAATGRIGGAGTLRLGSAGTGTLTNQGVLAPGSSGIGNGLGSLAITGNLVQTTGQMLIDLQGTTAGSFDQIKVSGSATLGGGLRATLGGVYAPVVGDFVPVLLAASRTGTSTLDSLTGAAGFSASYGVAGGEAVRLVFAGGNGNVGGASIVFSNAAGTLDWNTAANWTGGKLPGYDDSAVLSSGLAVGYASGNAVIAGLTLSAGNALAVSGGNFTVRGSSTLAGSFSLSGSGNAVLAGPVSGGGTVSVGSGRSLTLGGSAQLGDVSIGGGTLSLQGAAQFGSLALNAGTLNGLGDLSVSRGLTVTGTASSLIGGSGALMTAGSSSVRTTNSALLQVEGGRAWTNSGTLDLSAGAVQLGSGTLGGTLVNAASGNVLLDGAVAAPIAQLNASNLVNLGTVRKSGAGTQAIDLTNFDQAGTLAVDSGTLRLAGGRSTGATTVAANATLALTAGSRTMADAALPTGAGSLLVSGGSLQLQSSEPTLNLLPLTVTGGSVTARGAGALAASTLAISGGTAALVAGSTLTASAIDLQGGSLTLDAGTALRLPSALALRNGTLTLDAAAGGTFSAVSLSNATLGGNIDLQIDRLTVTGSTSSSLAGSGSLVTTADTVIDLASGTATLNVSGSRPWSNRGTLTIAGDDSLTLGAGGRLVNEGAMVLAGTAAVPIGQSGPSTLVNLGVINKNSLGTQTLDVTTFQNDGQVIVSDGTLRVGAGAGGGGFVVGQGATLELYTGTRYFGADALPAGGGRLLVSGGTAQIASDQDAGLALPPLAITAGAVNVRSAGPISVDALSLGGGTLRLDTPDTVTLPSLALSGTGLSVHAGRGVSLPQDLQLVGGSFTLDSPSVSIGSLRMVNASLLGATDVTVTGTLEVLGSGNSVIGGSGVLRTQGLTRIDIAAGASLLQVAGTRSWENSGTLRLSGDDAIQFGTGGVGGSFVNKLGGTLELSGTNASPLQQVAASSFTNLGSLSKLGSATQRIALDSFHQLGTLAVQAGTLELAGGTSSGSTTVAAGATLSFVGGTRQYSGAAVPTGAGTLRVGSGSTVSMDDGGTGALNLLPLVQAGGTLDVRSSGTLVAASLTQTAGSTRLNSGADLSLPQLSLTGGTVLLDAVSTITLPALALTGTTLGLHAGSGVVLPDTASLINSTLTLDTPRVDFTSLSLAGATLAGQADVAVSGALQVTGSAASTIGGSGRFSTAGSTTVQIGGGASSLNLGAGRQWANSGTLSVLGDDAVSLAAGASLVNTGTMVLATSSTTPITQSGAGASFVNAGTLRVSGDGTHKLSVDSFNHTGTLQLDGGTLQLQGGISTGTTVLAAGTTLSFVSGTRSMVGAAVPTGGGQLLVDGGTARFDDGTTGSLSLLPTTVNSGALGVTARGPISLPALQVAGGSASVNGADAVTLGALGLRNGTLDVSAGTQANLPPLSLTSATLSVQAGQQIVLPGAATLVSTTLSLTAPSSTLGALSLGASTLSGAGDVTVTGNVDVSGAAASTLGGSGRFVTQGSTRVDIGGAATTLNVAGGRQWVNSGTLTIGGDDSITLGTSSLPGRMSNLAGGQIVLAGSSATPITQSTASLLDNAGEIRKSANGTQTLNLATLNQSGTLAVDAGVLALGGTLNQSGGIHIAAGATLQTSGSLVNATGGVIDGRGTLRLGSAGNGTLTNSGTLRPGSSPGTLAVAGDLDLTGGTLEIEVGGLAVGTESDLLKVAGNVRLGGTLKVSLWGGYSPANADAVAFIQQTGTSTGLFQNLTLPQGYSVGYRLAANESARAIFSAFGGTKVFTNAAGDLDWNTPANWGGSLPGTLDTALISAGYAVAHRSGAHAITGLTLNSGNALDVSGGALSVSGATALDGLLRVSGSGAVQLGDVNGAGSLDLRGGSLQLDGRTQVAGLSLAAGRLTGGGALAVNGSFSRGSDVQVASSFTQLDLTQAVGTLQPGAWSVAGPVTLSASAGALVLDGAVSASTLTARASDSITLQPGALLSASDTGGTSLQLAAAGRFVNNAGANALAVQGGARWLVYSASPLDDNAGGLVPAFRQYAAQPDTTPVLGTGNGFLHVLAPQLHASLAGSVSKVYDAGTAASLDGVSVAFDGLLAIDRAVPGSALGAGSFDTRQAGSGKTISVSGLTAKVSDATGGFPVYGYSFDGTASGAIGRIDRAPLVVSGLAGGSKVYDASRSATLTGSASVAPLGSDVVGVSGSPTAQFDDKNVGSGKAITVTGITLSGVDAANYTAVLPTGLSGSISAAPLVVSGLGAVAKVYDAGTGATLTGTAAIAPLAGDSVNLAGNAAGRFADKNVGTAKPVSVSGLSLSGADAGNYTLQPVSGLSADITPAPLQLSGLSAVDKVYDASRAVTLAGSASIVPLAGDSLTLAGSVTAEFADKNVGSAKPVALGGLSLSGADAGNYTLQLPALAAGITARPITVDGVAVAGKVYDGGTSAGFSHAGSITPLAGDAVALAGTQAARFADKNAGIGKVVNLSGFALSGADAGNYALQAPTSTSADISPAPLVVNGLGAVAKVYDASTSATLTGTAAIAPLAGDSVNLAGNAAGRFADKNVGTAKPVSVSGLSLSGADAGNYTLQPVSGLSADITPAPLQLSGLSAVDKVYDASRAVTLAGSASIVPLAGDSLTLAGSVTAEFADKNVGSAKPVALGGLSLSGADAGNYTLQLPALAATIQPATAQLVNLAADAKVYDGSTAARLSSGLGGIFRGDGVTLDLSGQFASATAGAARDVNWTAQLRGPDAQNYRLPAVSGTVQAAIQQAVLSYVANQVSGTAGQPLPGLSGSVTGFVAGDTQASATTGSLSWSSSATVASPAGRYAVDGGGLQAVNYRFEQAPGNATALVLQAPATADPGTTATTVTNTAALLAVQPPIAMSTPTQGRVLDVTLAIGQADSDGLRLAAGDRAVTDQAALPASSVAAANAQRTADELRLLTQRLGTGLGDEAEGVGYKELDLSRLPRDEIQSLLAARARYKLKVFANGVHRVQQDPALADVRPCISVAELDSGACIITDQLKREIQAAQVKAAQLKAREERMRNVKSAALPAIERKLALVIGINKYADRRIPELTGAIPDARALRDMLQTRLGYEPTVVENANREAIIKAFNKLALEAQPNDSVIVYYAGHGVVVPVDGADTGFWVPSDGDSDKPDTWMSNADIARMVAAVGARQVMLVSDSCYSGRLVGKGSVQASSADADELLKRRAVVVMSSGGDEPVADQGRNGHSIFAWHFMRALEGLDTWQVGGSLFGRVRQAVVKEFPQTPQYGASQGAGHEGNTDYLFERRELQAIRP